MTLIRSMAIYPLIYPSLPIVWPSLILYFLRHWLRDDNISFQACYWLDLPILSNLNRMAIVELSVKMLNSPSDVRLDRKSEFSQRSTDALNPENAVRRRPGQLQLIWTQTAPWTLTGRGKLSVGYAMTTILAVFHWIVLWTSTKIPVRGRPNTSSTLISVSIQTLSAQAR